MNDIRILPSKGFDYINTGNPTASVNPPVALVTWLNATSGAIFVCTDNTIGANVWVDVSVHSKPAFRGAFAVAGFTTIATTGVWTALAFDTNEYDTDAFHDTSINNTRITIPTGVTKVRLTGGFDSDCAVNQRTIIAFRKNGAAFNGQSRQSTITSTVSTIMLSTTTPVLEVVAGDYFELFGYQDSGTNKTFASAASFTMLFVEVIE